MRVEKCNFIGQWILWFNRCGRQKTKYMTSLLIRTSLRCTSVWIYSAGCRLFLSSLLHAGLFNCSKIKTAISPPAWDGRVGNDGVWSNGSGCYGNGMCPRTACEVALNFTLMSGLIDCQMQRKQVMAGSAFEECNCHRAMWAFSLSLFLSLAFFLVFCSSLSGSSSRSSCSVFLHVMSCLGFGGSHGSACQGEKSML